MAKKIEQIKIDQQKCIGCGSCAFLAPDAFDTAEGKAKVKPGWKKVLPEDLRRACDFCPVQAITLEEG